METLLYIVFFVSCLVLVIAVLLQPGKTDAGALFTSGVSSAALNPRGTQSVLSKITIGAATTFMVTALLLSLPALTGNRSVLSTESEEPVAANSNVNANSNSATNAPGVDSNASSSNSASANTEVKKDEGDSKPEAKEDGDAESKSEGSDKPETKDTESKEDSKSGDGE